MTTITNRLLSFKAGKYDFALLDIKMPRMNGFELHRENQKKDRRGGQGMLHYCIRCILHTSLKKIFE